MRGEYRFPMKVAAAARLIPEAEGGAQISRIDVPRTTAQHPEWRPRLHRLAKASSANTRSRKRHVSPCVRCAIQLRKRRVTSSNVNSPAWYAVCIFRKRRRERRKFSVRTRMRSGKTRKPTKLAPRAVLNSWLLIG